MEDLHPIIAKVIFSTDLLIVPIFIYGLHEIRTYEDYEDKEIRHSLLAGFIMILLVEFLVYIWV